jgi:hypothetical protein
MHFLTVYSFHFVQVGGLRGGMMVDHMSNKWISAHGHYFILGRLGSFVSSWELFSQNDMRYMRSQCYGCVAAYLDYQGCLPLFCKCGFVCLYRGL